MSDLSRESGSRGWIAGTALLLTLSLLHRPTAAQDLRGSSHTHAAPERADLPDSPGALLTASTSTGEGVADTPAAPTRNVQESAVLVPARKNHRVVRPWEEAGPLTAAGKLRLSIMSRLTLGEAGATSVAAGWSQLNDSRPHTGTDSGAFGERLGDLAIKQTSQSVLTYGIFAAAFHDDPRYYVLGDRKPIVRRAIYSALGILIARKDDGSSAINWPRFAGIAGATALTNLYYPTVDHGFGNSAKAFTSSIGSAVLNNELHEFSGDLFHLLPHHQNH